MRKGWLTYLTVAAFVLAAAVGLYAQNPFTLYFGTAPADTNSGNKSAQTLRVTLATDQVQLTNPLLVTLSGTNNIATVSTVTTVSAVTAITNALPAGSNVIGHVIADTGSTTAVTGNVTVVQGTGTNLHTVLDANSGVDIGKLTANQSVNVAQINGVTTLMGNGVTGTGSQRVTIASDNTAFSVNATLQTQTDTVMVGGVNLKEINAVTPLMGNGVTGTGSLRVTVASDNTAFSVNGTLQTQTDTVMVGGVNIKEINAVTPLMGNGATGTGALRVSIANDSTGVVQPGNTANTTPWLVQAVPGAANGLSWYNVEPGASDNHANIKNGAGVVYHIQAMNNSATVNYWRLYNAATGFNGCNSATNLLMSGMIPASTSAAGFVEDIAAGVTFSTGISVCVTGAYGQTSTTAATATAIEFNVGYK